MMKKIIFYITGAALLVLGCNANSLVSTSKPTMTLYFHGFNVSPYVPVTMQNIEELADYKINFYGENVFIEEVQVFLETKPEMVQIDNQIIRLKVDISNDNKKVTYYVDDNGVVLKNGKETFLLSEDEQEKLEKNIVYFHGVVDMRPGIDPWGGHSFDIFSPGYSPIFR